jgi:hypothetical protein
MENTRPTKTKNEPGSPADTSGDSIKSGLVAVTGSAESVNSSAGTTATMRKGSKKTWKNAELEELRLKVGLVAGALADFQAAGGIVAVRNIEYEPGQFSVKLYLVAEGLNLVAQRTTDGLDFEIQPLPSGIVAEDEHE